MSESATEARIRELSRQLNNEETAHTRTRNELQAEIERVWCLVPGHWINLMGAFPPLRQLLHVLAQAANLQDPSRGAPHEDVMRTEYTPDGETLTPTELGVVIHARDRAAVAEMVKQLKWFTHKLSKLIAGDPDIEYHPPEGACQECGRLLFQNDTGRPRRYCSAKCRQRASRKVEA